MQGIGEKMERKLWAKGILSWEEFLLAGGEDMGLAKKYFYDDILRDARQNLNQGNAGFFTRMLRPREHWRLFQDFKDHAVALDIESNGLPAHSGGYVTVAGLYDGFDYKAFVKGVNLSREALERELGRYKYLITFFGSVFDLPFLRETLGVNYTGLHFDLCFGGKKAGLKGGLKKIEALLGIERDESVKGFSGFDAVRLWSEAQKGSSQARELLITYNRYDTVNLFEIAEMLYYMLRAQTGIADFLGA